MSDNEERELRNMLSPILIYFEVAKTHIECENNLTKDSQYYCEFHKSCDNNEFRKNVEDLIINVTIPEMKKLLKL